MSDPDEVDALSDLECAIYLQKLLIAVATGILTKDDHGYGAVRSRFMGNAVLAKLLPQCVRACRNLAQFWSYIKPKFETYEERKRYLWSEMQGLLDYLEGHHKTPADDSISDRLKQFDADGVHAIWAKTLERRIGDPEGAITSARTLLETVCKHVLDAQGVAYDSKADLPALYALTSKSLRLAPHQYAEDTFKKILGGVTAVVGELGSLRNRLGDAHGQGRQAVKPGERHAALAVNLAGSIAMFIVDTFNARNEEGVRPS